MSDFAMFWRLYPRKVGRVPALKTWDKLLKLGADPAAIIAGLHRYMADKEEWRQWCHPATFLGQQRWRDYEPIEAPASTEAPATIRLIKGCEAPPDIPDGAQPVVKTFHEVTWLLPDGSRVQKPRFLRTSVG